MLIIPAIDIKDNRVVRLWQGDYNKATVYSDDPVETAIFWETQGAQLLHLVDLDGALQGIPKNLEVIKKIAAKIKIPVEVGGGLRGKTEISDLLENKVERIIISTKAYEDLKGFEQIVNEFPGKLCVSLDIKEGFLASRGWIKKTDIRPEEFVKKIKPLGVNLFILTDVARDGTMVGLDVNYIREFLLQASIKIIIAGGIGSLDDIRALRELEKYGLEGVIVGRALYENKFILKEAMEIAQ